MAWRVWVEHEETQPKELLIEVFIPEGAQPQDPVRARWKDGFEHEVSSVTAEPWKAREEAKPCKKRGTRWSNEEGFEVRPKKDCNPEGLLVLRGPDGAQKRQVRVGQAGRMGKDINIMIQCVEAAMAGADPYEVRDQFLASSSTASPHEQPKSEARCELQMSDVQEASSSKSSMKRPAARTCGIIVLSQRPEANKKTKGSSLDMEGDFTALPF